MLWHSPQWRSRNLICSGEADGIRVEEQPMPAMRADLLALFETDELAKYLTPEEMAAVTTGGDTTGGSGS